MSSLRVLLVTHRFLPKFLAGTEIYTAALAKGLARHGHYVHIFTGDPTAQTTADYEWDGLSVTAVPWGSSGRSSPVSTFLAAFGNRQAEAAFLALCRRFRPDAIHVQHLMGLSSNLLKLGRRCGARVIVTLHDFWFLCSNTWLFRWDRVLCPGPGWGFYCGGCALHRLGREPHPVLMVLAAPIFAARTRLLRAALQQADHFIAPSHLSRSLFVKFGVAAERISVVPSVVLDMPPRQPRPARDTNQPLRFVYIGSLTPPKGVHVALAAFNGLSDANVEFHIYGDLSADPAYAVELRRLARHPGVEFRNAVPRTAVADVLGGADLLLLPSLWYESYSIIIDEAFMFGVPVLASNHGAPAERIIPEVNGLTAPPGDVSAWQRQMQRFIQEPELREKLRCIMTSVPRLDQHCIEIEAIYRKGPDQTHP